MLDDERPRGLVGYEADAEADASNDQDGKIRGEGLKEGEAADAKKGDEGDSPGPVPGKPEVQGDGEKEVAEDDRGAEPALLDGGELQLISHVGEEEANDEDGGEGHSDTRGQVADYDPPAFEAIYILLNGLLPPLERVLSAPVRETLRQAQGERMWVIF